MYTCKCFDCGEFFLHENKRSITCEKCKTPKNIVTEEELIETFGKEDYQFVPLIDTKNWVVRVNEPLSGVFLETNKKTKNRPY